MVMITGLLRDATGLPLTSPLSITLTDYGVAPPSTLYLPAKIVVQPDLNGAFSVDLWANQSSAHPCLYRVETPQGSSFLISVPGGELGPLDIGNLVVTKADLREDTNILNRIARLEADGGGTGPSPGGGGELLTFGDGLVGGSYDGSAPVTVSVANTIARLNSPTFTSPRSNTPAAGDNSTLLATTAWSSNADNITSGTLPSARLPSNLAATTAQRLATPRSILGTPFDGTADIPPLTLGSGLVAPSASSLNIDFNVVASAGDTRFTNSREWTATTVTQVEAESGTDVNRRAWTAQRVRQAITAWWAGVEGTLARLVSPAFTGTPTAPTAPSGDASTRLATTAWAGNASNLTLGTIPAARVPTLNQNTTGTAANVTGVVALSNGGTGSNTKNFVDISTNQAGIGGDKSFNGYISLGEGNTGLKCKVLTGTTPATQGANVTIAHGLTGSKILGWTSKVSNSPDAGVISGFSQVVGGYSYAVNHTSDVFALYLTESDSSLILSKPFYIMVWYKA